MTGVQTCALPIFPADARVEMDAKKAAGYFTEAADPAAVDLANTQGRGLDKY